MALKTKLKMEMKANSCHPKINLAEYCRDGRWEEVGNVLNCCGCLVNDKSESNWTPLMYACSENKIELVRQLISIGADVNACDLLMDTPLTSASRNGFKTVIDLLLMAPDIDVNVQTKYGDTALMSACSQNNIEIFCALLAVPEVNVNLTDITNKQSVLISAAYGGKTAFVRELLRREDIDINLQDDTGQTALFLATKYGYKDIVRLLLQRDEIALTADMNGVTPLEIGRQRRREEIVTLLEEFIAGEAGRYLLK